MLSKITPQHREQSCCQIQCHYETSHLHGILETSNSQVKEFSAPSSDRMVIPFPLTQVSRPFRHRVCTHHDAIVNEALPVSCRFQMWILFSAGDLNTPDLLPSCIQLYMDRVDPWVMRGHCVAQVGRYSMFLKEIRRTPSWSGGNWVN